MVFRRKKPEPDPAPFPTDANEEPLRNTAIVEAMRNVSVADSPQARALLYQLLLESTLVVSTPDAAATPTTWTAQAGDTMRLVTLQDDEGTVLPVFTSVDSLLVWQPEGGGYAALPARALFEMAANTDTTKIAIDLGSPVRGFVTRYEIEALARGRLPVADGEVVAEATEVQIGRPAVPPPPETIAAVRDALAAEPRAARAWLYLMQQGAAAPELVIAIRLADGVVGDDERAAMRAVIDDAGRRADGVRELRFTCPDPGLEEALATGAGEEIFRRS